MEMQQEYGRWVERADEGLQAQLAKMEGDADALADAFFRTLAFGTGGLRGVLGAGTNRMNVHTVAQATQGLADYLNASFDAPSVAIARDSRHMGEEFVQVAAGVLAANGVAAHVFPRVEPTPALSFAVRHLGCSAGINITASHNPATYNGYKVYGPDGCQITTHAAEAIQQAIAQVDIFDGVASAPFDDALASGKALWIGDEVLDAYVEAVLALRQTDAPDAALSVAYTPLCGTGLECVSRALEGAGVGEVHVVTEQAQPNGSFPTCEYPNPEEREALARGIALMERSGADLLLATDPDADRLGVAVAHGGGQALLTGNEVGLLLVDYLCAMHQASGADLSEKVVLTTVVSTTMADALSAKWGFELRRTLTGFKYIGEQIALLEQEGRAESFLFGFEESYGFLSGTHARDKDAVNAAVLLCDCAAWHAASGRDLVDALEALYAELGHFRNRNVSVSFEGAQGAAQMQGIMAGLRAQSPAQVAGLAVQRVVDYLPGAPMPITGGRGGAASQVLPPADVVELALECGNKVIVRPSGTEPKVKVYLFARGDTAEEADAVLARLEDAARSLL